MKRLSALFAVTCVVLLQACMDDSSITSDEWFDSEVLAQQVIPQTDTLPGPPLPAGEVQSTVEAPVGTKVIRMKVANIQGTGCSRKLTQVRRGGTQANDEVELDLGGDNFRIFLPENPGEISSKITCVITLRVSGVAGIQAAVHKVQFRGNENLAKYATASVDVKIMWREDAYDSVTTNGHLERLGPSEGAWFMDTGASLSAKPARSKCLASSAQEDIAYIELTIGATSKNKEAPSQFDVNWARSVGFDLEPNQSSELLPPVAYRLGALPCTP